MTLSAKELKFVSEVAHGSSPREAYETIYNPTTKNKDSLRAMASRIMNRPGVRESIETVKAQIQDEMITTCIWDARAAMIARLTDVRRLDTEINRQLKGIDMELSGIDMDETLSESEKLQKKGRVMQKTVIARTVQAKQDIYADLDKSISGIKDGSEPCLAQRLLDLSFDNIKENPDAYAENTKNKTHDSDENNQTYAEG